MGILLFNIIRERETLTMLSSNADKNLTNYGRIMLTCISGEVQQVPSTASSTEAPNVTGEVSKKGLEAFGDLLKENNNIGQVFDQIKNDESLNAEDIPSMDDMKDLLKTFSKDDWDSITKPELGVGSEDLVKALEGMEEPNIDDEAMEKLQDLFSPFLKGGADGELDETTAQQIMSFTEDPSFENLKSLPASFMGDVLKLTEELGKKENQALFDPIIEKLPNEDLKKMFTEGFGNLQDMSNLINAQREEEGDKDGNKIIDQDDSDFTSDDSDGEQDTEVDLEGRTGSIADKEVSGDDTNAIQQNADALELFD